MRATVDLHPGSVSLTALRRVASGPVRLALSPSCYESVDAALALVRRIGEQPRPAYGITTGFGLLAQKRIDPAQQQELQRRLVLSHAAGIGVPLPDPVVRLVIALKAVSLARGHSGVRQEVINALLALVNNDVLPCIPEKGSVGASGDLAPLAHLAAALIGVGQVRVEGCLLPASDGLARAGIMPLVLEPKEGLALLNGTQVSTALALAGLFAAESVFAAATVAGAMSVDAFKGSDEPFDDRIHAIRGHPGQRAVAACYLSLLEGSEIRASHRDCARVQDPYSLRCQPQVMGACLDHLSFAARCFGVEANSVSDNPLVFPEEGNILSGGNFHGEPVAMAADTLALAIAEIGAMSERRIALLTDPHMSGLPPFLVEDSGLNSGFMIAQVTAAALASENKALAHPVSVDSLPTSANQEDHVSMSAYAARRLMTMAENSAAIVGIELLAASQGLEFHRPLRTSPMLGEALALVRDRVSYYERDRFFAPDISAASELVRSGSFTRFVPASLLPSFRKFQEDAA